MPGIAGLITKKPRAWAEEQLAKMIATLRHDSSYVSGTWVDEQLGVYIGWMARSGSFAARMPVSNTVTDTCLIYSGEDYADPGVVDDLRRRGHTVDESEASYIVHMYDEDQSFPAGLNGRFHGVVSDRNRRRVTLFNDRYGMH